jgi:8-hydroxy-5-deazaflavin:NADPH oxidoreductase
MSSIKALPVLAILGGTGKEGSGLALRWAMAGYPVIIGSRRLDKAQATAAELNKALGRDAVKGMVNHHAARAADICVLTVIQAAHRVTLESLKDDLSGKILVDATTRVDYREPKPPAPPSAGRLAQDLLGADVRVVAAFQNVPASALKKNLGQRLDQEVLICADDLQAAESVTRLAEAAGMRAYYAGNLDQAIVVEGLTAILINLNKYYGTKTASIGITGINDQELA